MSRRVQQNIPITSAHLIQRSVRDHHCLIYQSGRTGSRVLGWWKFAEASQKIAIILIANPRISSQLSVSREILNTGKFLVPAFD